MSHPPIPSPEQYEQAFLAVENRITPAQKAMLQAHYRARGRVITASNLAHAVGFESYHAANLHYGLLAQMLREALRLPHTGTELDMLVSFVPPGTQSNDHWLLVMRDEVARALEALGWV
jgi:hypothetical protein